MSQSQRPSDAGELPRPGSLRRLVSELAIQDYLVAVFMCMLIYVSVTAPSSAPQRRVSALLVALGSFNLATVILVRTHWLSWSWPRAILYRLALLLPVQSSYFILGTLLPIVSPHSFDRELYHLDLTLFGVEPALALDDLVNTWTSEWFAFFYFCYFFIIAIHIFGILFFSRRARVLGEFSFGFIFCFCLGHTLYMLVPGFGPYRALAPLFENPFPDAQWVDMVMGVVASGGAQKDIFPSLHTAAPTFVALFSYRQRHLVPFRYTWPVVFFFALNIMGATLFLRWHYVVDVVAGLLLAAAACELGMRVTEHERWRRAKHGLSPMWPPLPTRAGSQR